MALSCLSGGYPYFLRTLRTAFLIPALTLSLTVQSMVAFLLTVSTSSWAMVRRVSSPSTCTALSLVSRAS